ncbi:MAG: hypothetical protein AVDCRST_MAG66-1424 [uncultured Pseudonocardia sp.]|uniref:Uncharacterized protein n=1 Tax=uncultured Pseudonocardia sp. TaxID=211455 RepID=A0A6J4P000_9PSEU|nr:MAG: hypothetical protein AVDCRST_MAG66-1424 [uncultured Pseudonocardia sp.]
MARRDRPDHRAAVHPRLDESRGQPQRGGPGPAQTAGVHVQPGVEAAGDVDVERRAEGVEHPVGEHDGGLGVRVEQLDVPETGVGGVVVEHHHRAGRGEPVGERPQPGRFGGVADHQQLGPRRHRRGRDDQTADVEREQPVRHPVGRRERHPRPGAPPVQRDAQRQRAAERVGVGLDVGEQGDVAGGGEQRGGRPDGVGDHVRSFLRSADVIHGA